MSKIHTILKATYKYTTIEGASHFVDNAKNVLLLNKTYCGEQDVDADLMEIEGKNAFLLTHIDLNSKAVISSPKWNTNSKK